MTEDKNTTTDEPTYTRVLSRIFPSYAGCSTSLEYSDARERLLWTFWFLFILDVFLYFAVHDSSYIFTILIILIQLPVIYVREEDICICIRRFHACGMSCTCSLLIPCAVLCIIGAISAFTCTPDTVKPVVLTILLISFVYGWWLLKKLGKVNDWDKAQYKNNICDW